MKKYMPFLAVLVSFSVLYGKQEQRSCASHKDKWLEELNLHRLAEGSESKKLSSAAKQALRLFPDLGHIAHLDDADGVVARRNPFNLHSRTLRFTPTADGKSYRFELTAGSYDTEAAQNGTLITGIGDDDTRELSLPWAFPFYGTGRRSYFVNSDGNLSFDTGDAAITDRSLGRFLAGSPRIAPLFADLDPTRARDGIRVLNAADRVVISWSEVPEFRDFGGGPLQTFQIRLYPDGKIEFAYSKSQITDAVTGITPGGLQADPTILSFVNGPASATATGALVERFSGSESVDVFAAAQRFYRNHGDAYDYLVIYNTLGIPAEASAVAYEVTVRNQRSGYGDVKTDVGTQAGSAGRLQAILNMGPLDQYPRDADARVPARFSVGDTPLSTLAHEAGHLFLSYVSVRDENGSTPMLGYQSAHWDFKFNSDASLMEGNRIQDNGAGASPRFQTIATVQGFSALDQYLMGFLPPEQVPDTFYVRNTRNGAASGLPRVGAAFDGDRRDVSVRELIEVSGRRTPDHSVAQRRFRFAFLIVTPNGESPTADQLSQVDNYRALFEGYFAKVTGGRAAADTSIRNAVRLSSYPAVGVMQGVPGRITLAIDQSAREPLTFQLRTPVGVVQAPQSVVIPAGSREATISLTGIREGVEDISIESSDPTYERPMIRVQVNPPAKVRLSILSDANPVRLLVTDINELPYPGLTVEAKVVKGGSLDRASATTSADGTVEFQWAEVQAERELVATVVSGPAVTITTDLKPAFAATSVVNAASFAPGLAPGGIATLFGMRLGERNARLLINGRAAEILFASDSQLNFVVPSQTREGLAELIVQNGPLVSSSTRIPVVAVQPGIFNNSQSGFGAVLAAGTGQVTELRPVQAGEFIEVYATGLGVASIGSSGLPETLIRPKATIAGVDAEVSYSGPIASLPGLYLVNVRVPAGVPAGTQSLILTSGGVASNEVKIRTR